MPQHGILEILSPFTGPYRLPLVAIEVAAAAAVVVVVVGVVVIAGHLESRPSTPAAASTGRYRPDRSDTYASTEYSGVFLGRARV